ncbi:hypothetical protein [Anaeroselena agilis]|uniref:Uncharacterized protein n=1 Tax=Anaeroselena agilis TaxID=3063788 RepID=A0ABU3NVM9_9FIRM|nr:hypothetical protein [Selenomonadales bacterium 4137-cl]
MTRRRRRRKCPIEKGIKIICPHCGAIVVVPMCKAVNGEQINCSKCQQDFVFGA